MNEYRFSYDSDYVLRSSERYRRQRHVYPWFIAVKAFCGLGLAALLGVVVYGALNTGGNAVPLVVIATVLGTFILLLVQGSRIDYFFLKRRLKKSPFYRDDIQVELSDSGVCVSSARSQTALQWSAFTKARRLSDGFLVFVGPTVFFWWPDAALTAGALDEVKRLLEAKISA